MANNSVALFCALVLSLLSQQGIYAQISDNDRIVKSLNLDSLQNTFGLCEKKRDTIVIFDNTHRFGAFTTRLECNKVVSFENSNIPIRVGSSENKEDKLVLSFYGIDENHFVLAFINIQQDLTFTVWMDEQGKIVRTKKDVY